MTDTSILATRTRVVPLLAAGITLGTALLLVVGVAALWTPFPVEGGDMGAALQGPGGQHWLGTDPLGRDVVSLVMKGILSSAGISVTAVLLGALVGVPAGLAMSLRAPPRHPGGGGSAVLLSALFAAALLGVTFGASSLTAIAALAIANVAPISMATRSAVLPLRDRGYMDSARLAGFSWGEALRRHAMPQIAAGVGAQCARLFGLGATVEVTLGYLGLAIQPPAASLGLLLRDAQTYMSAKPLLVIAPAAALGLIVLTSVLVAAGLRDLGRQGGDDGVA